VNHVRRPLVGLIALFTAAITIDRIGLANGGGAISTRTYAVAAIAAAVPLMSHPRRTLRRWSLPLLAVATDLALATATGSGPASPQFEPHIAATAAAFISLTALIGQHLARSLTAIDEAVGEAAGGEIRALDVESPAAAAEIHTEIARSRRHDHPLSVTVLAAEPEGFAEAITAAGPEVQRALRERFVFGRLARVVGDQLRRSDLLFEHRASGRLFVVSPETGGEGTSLLTERINRATRQMGVEIATGSASFPDDAVSFEHLVECAEQNLAAGLRGPDLRAVLEGGAS